MFYVFTGFILGAGVTAGTVCYQHDKDVESCAIAGTAAGVAWPYIVYKLAD